MSDGPNIVRIAALVGDHARAEVLTALLAGQALTATELAEIAGVTKQTISAHLAKLLDGGLVYMERQGRHRYFRLADRDVAQLLESLMGIATRTGALRLRSGPRDPALRKARACYDHLAGELGVHAFDVLLKRRVFDLHHNVLRLTPDGRGWFASFGVDATAAAASRRALCRPCLDWGERRHHLGGALGAALLAHVCDAGWTRRARGSRVLEFSLQGEKAFRELLASGRTGASVRSKNRNGSRP